jgi:Fe-S oxidoreductase
MNELKVKTMAEYVAAGEQPEILFWVGCAGSFDDRAKKITRAIVKILNHAGIKFAVLGTEESCTGDPAKRAGNEFLFQMQAFNNITVLNNYGVKKIVTGCPHCFNTLKNEYPSLGGNYEVIHHTQLIQQLLDSGRLKIKKDSTSLPKGEFARGRIRLGEGQGWAITYHDACYLGRANDVYEAPRYVLQNLNAKFAEMKRSREKSFCCGAGGAQMFKEPEKGNKDVNIERTEEALSLKPDVIATACPFCMTMLTDGVKHFNKENETKVMDVAELVADSLL